MSALIFVNKIIFAGSLLGMGIMIFAKLPEAKNLPDLETRKKRKKILIKKRVYRFKKFFLKGLVKKVVLIIRSVKLLPEKIIGNVNNKKTGKNTREKRDDYWDRIIKTSKKK